MGEIIIALVGEFPVLDTVDIQYAKVESAVAIGVRQNGQRESCTFSLERMQTLYIIVFK